MMEFTYDGMVRWGFGFANPNHAAAFICALLPFFWGWKKYPRSGLFLSIPLFLGLLLTFSRTGLAVAFFELATFYILSRNRNWKSFCTILCCLTAAAALTGVLARFALDKSVTNRPEIWFAGLRLYANNPWGVGMGNSGRIVSAFLLPDSIQCRTLVSSHLTLLTEWGLFAGFCWFGVLFYALIRGIRYPAVWCSLAGWAISAGMSSVFDAGTLFDFRPDRANFWLSWTVLLFYFTLLGIALWGKFHWRSGVVAVVGAGLICVGGGLFRSEIAPRVEQEYLVLQGKGGVFLVYGNDWILRDLRPFFTKGCVVPLQSGLPERKYAGTANLRKTVLFGDACVYGAQFHSPVYFVQPSEFVEFPPGLAGVYLPAFDDQDVLRSRLKEAGIPILPLPEF